MILLNLVRASAFIDAVDTVLLHLKLYRGGAVQKAAHPLHKAVVDLEQQSCITGYSKQPRALFAPANAIWYRLLWESRGTHRPKNPDKARKHAGELALILKGQRSIIKAHMEGRLVVVTDRTNAAT